MALRQLRQLQWRRTLYATSSKTSVSQLQSRIAPQKLDLFPTRGAQPMRFYSSEMRRAAFEDNILRMLRKEIQYELDESPPKQPYTKFESFTVDERPGEQWIRLTRRFGENEEIKIEVTMFDSFIPIQKSGGDDQTKVPDDVKLHITLIVNISKDDDDEVFEIMCSAWPDSIEIKKLFIRRSNKMPTKPYCGPEFSDLDDKLQMSLYEFLETRGITDQLATFLHEYMKNKGKTEYIRWMGNVKSYIEEK